MQAVPPRPDLLGRAEEMAHLADLLTSARVVTLTGLAGVGKTCLALAALHDCADRFPGGASGMAITDGARRDEILASVASVFGAARAVDLIDRYDGRPALIMFDGADRSPRAAVEAIRWLRARAPDLTMLITSRHPLGVPGEIHRRVEPLDLPPAAPEPADLDLDPDDGGVSASTLEDLRSYPAVALFLHRLYEVRPEPVQEHDAPVLAELVRRLGGLPLALELAAARGRVLDLPELLERYRDRVLDLAHVEPEGATLRDALAASYRLLEDRDQAALRRLSVFRGRWSLELAEDLLTDPAGVPKGDVPNGGVAERPGKLDVEAVLDRLVGLGLVNVRPGVELRFRLLDMVRDFAAEECAARGETAVVRGCHARVLARLAVRTAPRLVGATMADAVDRLDRLAADVRGASAYAAVHDPHTALRLAAAVVRWCRFRGRDQEARALLRRLLDDPRTAGASTVVRAWAASGAAMLAAEHGGGLVELAGAQEALQVFIAGGNVAGELSTRLTLCRLGQVIGRHDDVRRHAEAVSALAGRTGRIREVAVAECFSAWQRARKADLPAAARTLGRAARQAATAGDDRLVAVVEAALAEVARRGGDPAQAAERGRAALQVLTAYGHPADRIRILGTIGSALAELGRTTEAASVRAELAGYGTAAAGVRAFVDGAIALAGGNRPGAAIAFGAAADLLVGRYDVLYVLEAMVGAAAATDDPAMRADIVADVQALCGHNEITLLPRHREVLTGRTAAAPR
jgi:predicted ATPase